MALKRKPAKRRPPGVGCQVRHGRRVCRQDAIMVVGAVRCCAKHAADRLFSRHVRESGPCIASDYRFPCGGIIEAAHVITRARLAIRWSEDNVKPLCSGHHVWFTHNPDAWRAFVVEQGIDYEGLRRRAAVDPPMDPEAVIERYRGRAA